MLWKPGNSNDERFYLETRFIEFVSKSSIGREFKRAKNKNNELGMLWYLYELQIIEANYER